MYEVMDGVRKLKVDGTLLAESSSQESYKDRWVEFRLFKTPSGVYVVSRVGHSRLYHAAECATVSRNKLSGINPDDLPKGLQPCSRCKPNWTDSEGVFPETPRPWVAQCQNARGVIASVMKYDENNNTEYLTNVARDLLEAASKVDDDIRDEYYTEVIN